MSDQADLALAGKLAAVLAQAAAAEVVRVQDEALAIKSREFLDAAFRNEAFQAEVVALLRSPFAAQGDELLEAVRASEARMTGLVQQAGRSATLAGDSANEAADCLRAVNGFAEMFASWESKLKTLLEMVDAGMIQGDGGDRDASSFSKYAYLIEPDEDRFIDDAWARAIERGQREQLKVWKQGQEYWSKRERSPYGGGWLGSAVSPLIELVVADPWVHARGTLRVPGRMQGRAATRWGSIVYCEGDRGRSLIDNNGWGKQTNAPVGFYVEHGCEVGGAMIYGFEQGLQDLIIVGLNGVLPIYIAQSPDRMHFYRLKILSHQGALVGIKHGPELRAPWFTVKQRPDSNVSLPDPVFSGLQMEGPHSSMYGQAAAMLAGVNGLFESNLYGWQQGPMVFSDHQWDVSVRVNDSVTGDGRSYTTPDRILPYCISQVKGVPRSKASAAFFRDGWYVKKGSLAEESRGFYVKGQRII